MDPGMLASKAPTQELQWLLLEIGVLSVGRPLTRALVLRGLY